MSCGYEIKPISSPIEHGEGPFWCPKTNTLYWVDTFEATLYRLLPTGNVQSFKLEGRDSVGFIIPVKDKIDTFLVYADREIYTVDWPRKPQLRPTLTHLVEIEKDKPTNQFNDGKADCKGRVWGGTLTRNEDLSVANFGGSLYMLNADCSKMVKKLPYTSISNGMAWTKNNKKYYYIDSITRHVVEYDFDADSGDISNGKIVFDLAKYPVYKGIPDGMTIDENDNLWIALHGGSYVLQVNPKSGKILQKIKMPVSYLTSVVFGGTNFDVLFVTTSWKKLDYPKLAQEPLAGSVFAVINLGVKGFPLNPVSL